MGSESKIEWTDASWNVAYGCTKVDRECRYCYINRSVPYRIRRLNFKGGKIPIMLLPDRLRPENPNNPLRWKEPKRIFVSSLTDLYHEDIPDDYIFEVEEIMRRAAWHTFQVLTKRPERMREIVKRLGPPPPNIWRGVTAGYQGALDHRVPILLDTPAAIRFVSCEPLLGPLNLRGRPADELDRCIVCGQSKAGHPPHGHSYRNRGLDWIIVGGESDGAERRRLVQPCNGETPDGHVVDGCGICDLSGWAPKPEALAMVRSIRDQCATGQVAFFFKQWGGPKPTSGGRLLDGEEWSQFPAA